MFRKLSTYVYGLTLLSLAATAWVYIDMQLFYNRYNFIPLDDRIYIDAGCEQTIPFSIDYEGTYRLFIRFASKLNFNSHQFTGTVVGNDGDSVDTFLRLKWEIRNGDSIIQASRSLSGREWGPEFRGNTDQRELPLLKLTPSQDYRMLVLSNISSPRLNATEPRVFMECVEAEYWDQAFRIVIPELVSIAMVFLSIVTFVGGLVSSLLRRRVSAQR